ncbi:MAG: eCIS core domain-containing protein [Myxococcota bacterium]
MMDSRELEMNGLMLRDPSRKQGSGAAQEQTEQGIHVDPQHPVVQRLHSQFGHQAVSAALSGADVGGIGTLITAEWAMGMAELGSLGFDSNAAMADLHSQIESPEWSEASDMMLSRHEEDSGPVHAQMAFELIRRSRGQALPTDLAARLQGVLGIDLSSTRIHTDTAAQHAAQAVNAHAFATGEDVFFAAGKYKPGTAEGDELLIHELTHVKQHQEGRIPTSTGEGLQVSSPSDAHEREAVSVAKEAMRSDEMQADWSPDSGGLESAEMSQSDGETGMAHRSVADLIRGAKDLYHDAAEAVGLETPEEADAGQLQAFIDHGIYGPKDLVPPTDIGGFAASLDPSSRILTIEVKGGVEFIDGLVMDSSGVVTSAHPDLDSAALTANSIPDLTARQQFVDQFIWDDKQAWIDTMAASVETSWGFEHAFTCTKPGWESLVIDVEVKVTLANGAPESTDHLLVTAYKVPDDRSFEVGAYVDSKRESDSSFRDQDPHNNQLVASSTDAESDPSVPSLLRRSIYFGHDSSVLDAAAKGEVSRFVADFEDAGLDNSNPVKLTGRASSSGSSSYNQRLSTDRVAATASEMSTAGFTGVSSRLTLNAEGETGA